MAFDTEAGNFVCLQGDLSKVDRQRTPWLLVLMHVPWYNSNRAHQGEGDKMMASMEPLLYAANVDIVLAGHVHAYERSVSLMQVFLMLILKNNCLEFMLTSYPNYG